ncbi:dihydrofolate reductase family protein [Chryseosolibacter indicus]|uniref:Dihydrofolate reductase family protein n=1 Tax=Chryseosolibacter indicus TaxID=2782351 RepID=A0ABS5VLB5_9BACT|nr:dihydrofolate reductase family protein [Chryseosolibacter indicus]MBT1702243.1 dihydrofolate reductase family protein [Chryseosolibacter indicus]
MRKIILAVAVTLDNFIEGPNGEIDWCFTDQDYGMTDFLNRIDTILYGRKSYELVVKMEGGLGMYGNKKNYVFSNTIKGQLEGAELVRGSTLEQVKEIKAAPGKDIWLFGGAALTESLMQANLVDEFWFTVHPIILGKGKPLFTNLQHPINLTLVNSKVYETGLVSLNYQLKEK